MQRHARARSQTGSTQEAGEQTRACLAGVQLVFPAGLHRHPLQRCGCCHCSAARYQPAEQACRCWACRVSDSRSATLDQLSSVPAPSWQSAHIGDGHSLFRPSSRHSPCTAKHQTTGKRAIDIGPNGLEGYEYATVTGAADGLDWTRRSTLPGREYMHAHLLWTTTSGSSKDLCYSYGTTASTSLAVVGKTGCVSAY